MGVYRRGVGDQSIERDERRNCRKDRQQRIEDDASRDGEQPVVDHARVDAPKDVFPPCPGNFPRRQSVSSPALLFRSAYLRRNRLIVLQLLPWPLVGIGRQHRGCIGGDFASLVIAGRANAAASTSNRNFEGRQGKGGRTHLVSPEVAVATAIAGHFATPDDLE